MLLVRDWQNAPLAETGVAVAIGNFDGVHRGHHEVVRRMLLIAAEHGLEPAVVTFEPHPRSYFSPQTPAMRLTTMREKAAIFSGLGVRRLYALRFNEALANTSAEQFIQRVLVQGLRAGAIITGADFTFGKGRTGNIELLAHMAGQGGYIYHAVTPVAEDGVVFSSSRIRAALRAGNMAEANGMLGRPYTIRGRVVRGDGRGRTIGFPTANIHLPTRKLLPADGVYAVHAQGNGARWLGVANLGMRPTFNGTRHCLEVHLFGAPGDLYDATLEIKIVGRLRGEERFAGVDALRAQIALDCTAAKHLLVAFLPAGVTA